VNHVDVEFVGSVPPNLIFRSDFVLKVISKCYKLRSTSIFPGGKLTDVLIVQPVCIIFGG